VCARRRFPVRRVSKATVLPGRRRVTPHEPETQSEWLGIGARLATCEPAEGFSHARSQPLIWSGMSHEIEVGWRSRAR
jgi:hypothetical protein